jgi:hypothetical protein
MAYDTTWFLPCITQCPVLGGTSSATRQPSRRSGLPPYHVLALLLTPMGDSSTLLSPHMEAATTILAAFLPTTSTGGLCPPTTHSPIMGGATFLLRTSPPLSMGVALFPLGLVSFPVRLHRLPQSLIFQAHHCALLWHTKNTALLPDWTS